MRKIETGEGQKNVNLIYMNRNILFDPRIHIQYVSEIRSQRNNQINFWKEKIICRILRNPLIIIMNI